MKILKIALIAATIAIGGAGAAEAKQWDRDHHDRGYHRGERDRHDRSYNGGYGYRHHREWRENRYYGHRRYEHHGRRHWG
ncbi:hypothetical protein [Sphingomonas sp. MMS24-J13]|uniref:hypothetical protein n=1 Tax=Sphingomonas sp. MMS24-J13 TaxID=3238686 RepID=UPI00384E8D86